MQVMIKLERLGYKALGRALETAAQTVMILS